ncbi:hypothetical protein N9195_00105 [bacterium]|nr:hypothetical protein [bacterium]
MFTARLKKLPFRLLAPLLALFTKCSGEVIISEFLAINSGAGITDEDNFPAD